MIQTRESRLGANQTANDSHADNPILGTQSGFHVEGAVIVDLRGLNGPFNENDHLIGRRIQRAAEAPHGAEVTFWVSPRQTPPPSPITYLRSTGQHLRRVAVWCECPATVKAWTLALRGEESL